MIQWTARFENTGLEGEKKRMTQTENQKRCMSEIREIHANGSFDNERNYYKI